MSHIILLYNLDEFDGYTPIVAIFKFFDLIF